MQFLFLSVHTAASTPETVAELVTKINATAALGPTYDLTQLHYPAVLSENDDWGQYVDEYYDDFGTIKQALPALVVIDQTGRFSAIRFYLSCYDTHGSIDWVVRRIDEILGGRQPVDTMLVLDRSGTMGGLPPVGSEIKIDVLKSAVGTFLDAWESTGVANDRIGVVDFDTSVANYVRPGGTSKLVTAADLDSVRAYVDGLAANGWTSMGGGIATAINALTASGRRHLILFSDGMQNYNPMVADDGLDLYVRKVAPADAGGYSLIEGIYGDSGVAPLPNELPSYDTHVHTIGVGVPSVPWTTLMLRLASATDGVHFETPAPEADLLNFYVNTLLETFSGATPQLVRRSSGTLQPGSAAISDACPINNSARWLTVIVSWSGDADRNQLRATLEAPDGTLIALDGRMKCADRSIVLSLPLPVYSRGRVVPHVGRWTLHLCGRNAAAIQWQTYWIVDDRLIHFEVFRPDRLYQKGEPFELRAKLTRSGKAFSARFVESVKASVAAPAIDVQQFVASYEPTAALVQKVRSLLRDRIPADDRALRRLALMHDAEAVAACAKKRVTRVTLEPLRGFSRASIALPKTGVYQIDVTATATDPRGGTVLRAKTVNVVAQ